MVISRVLLACRAESLCPCSAHRLGNDALGAPHVPDCSSALRPFTAVLQPWPRADARVAKTRRRQTEPVCECEVSWRGLFPLCARHVCTVWLVPVRGGAVARVGAGGGGVTRHHFQILLTLFSSTHSHTHTLIGVMATVTATVTAVLSGTRVLRPLTSLAPRARSRHRRQLHRGPPERPRNGRPLEHHRAAPRQVQGRERPGYPARLRLSHRVASSAPSAPLAPTLPRP